MLGGRRQGVIVSRSAPASPGNTPTSLRQLCQSQNAAFIKTQNCPLKTISTLHEDGSHKSLKEAQFVFNPLISVDHHHLQSSPDCLDCGVAQDKPDR